MQVGILGPLEVTDGAVTIGVGGARLRALLIRLAVDADRVVTVEALSDAVWPGGGPADPANALQSLVSRLRQALPAPAGVRFAPGGYRLPIPPDAVDITRFERLADEGWRLLRAGEPAAAADTLRSALRLWRGEPLMDAGDAAFAVAAAARLTELRISAQEDFAEARLRAGGGDDRLVAELEHLVTAHPLRERLRALLVRALHGAGRRAEGLAAFEAARVTLADELGTDPGPELRDAHLAALHDETVPVRGPRGNLREPLTGLIGRDDEQAAILKQLAHSRLVTLVGPGGAGKTRLAIAVGGALSSAVAGGVWLVELAPVAAPADVPGAVFGALGLRETTSLPIGAEAPADVLGHVVDALANRDAFVILDNCEHVLPAAADLAETLLGRCPRLRIVATSREPLGTVGEALSDVQPLGLPEEGANLPEAAASPAVRLFAERARDVRPGFAVDDATVDAVVEICRQLDGLPLAIELAAARVRALPVQDIAGRLGDRFDLLARRGRAAQGRHRTLRDVVGWSWDLLDPAERRFAQRLAVVPGTITVEAADRVGGSAATLDLLAALVDKSLLRVLDTPVPRFRMLETIRQYGLERLVEAGELEDARAAHVEYLIDLAERAEPALRGSDQVRWLVRLRDERDGLNAALQLARQTGDARSAHRLAAALGLFWTIDSDRREAARRLLLALETPGEPEPRARAVATAYYLFNTLLAGQATNAERIVAEIRAWASAPGQADGHPALVLIEPLLSLLDDDTERGLTQTAHLLADCPDPWTRAMLALTQALIRGAGGDLGAMCDDLRTAAAAFHTAGERWGLLTSRTILALALTMYGDLGAAAALEEAIELRRELDPGDGAVEQRAWLAQLHARTGQVERARAELLELVRPTAGAPTTYAVLAQILLGDIARHGGHLTEARRHYDAAGQLKDRSSDRTFDAVLASSRGHLAAVEGDLAAARQHLAEALAVAIGIRDMPLVAIVGVAVARLRAELGDPRRAAEMLGAADALRGAPDVLDPDVVGLTGRLRDALGERAFAAAHAAGRGLDRDGALALVTDHTRR